MKISRKLVTKNSWANIRNGSIERLNFCGFLLSTQEGVFPNDRDHRSEVLLKQRFSKRRSNIADKENAATSELNIQFRSSFSPWFYLSSCPCVVTKFQGMKNGFEDHPNQKLAHFIFSSNVDLPTKPSAFQFPVIIFLTSNDDRVWQSADVFSTALLLLLHL